MKKILILTASLFASSICYSGLKTDAVYFTVDGTTQTSAAFGAGGGTGSSGPSAYGSLYTKNGAANQAGISASTVTLTFFSNAGISTHAVSNATTDSVTVATTGIFNVYAVFVTSDNYGSANLHYSICVNGIPSNFSGSFNPINYYIPSSITGILSLSVGDVVTLCGFSNEPAGIGLSIVDSQFVVSSAGGIGGTTVSGGGGSSIGSTAYGTLYTSSGAINQTGITTTLTKLSFFSSAGISTHAVSNATTDTITVATTGVFNVYAVFTSTDFFISANRLRYYICVNDVPSNFSQSFDPSYSATAHFPVSITGILSLNTGDSVSLCGYVDTPTGQGFSVSDAQLIVSATGGIGGTTIISGGSSTSPLGVFKNGVQVSSPTSQINFSGNYWDITLGGTSTGTVKLIGGNTNYIQVSNSLQTGATAYPQFLNANTATIISSITVLGANGASVTYGVTAGSVTVNNLTASQFVKTDANKRLSSQAQINLLTEVTGILPELNLPSTVTYNTSNQRITGTKTYTSTQTFNNQVSFLSSNISDDNDIYYISDSATFEFVNDANDSPSTPIAEFKYIAGLPTPIEYSVLEINNGSVVVDGALSVSLPSVLDGVSNTAYLKMYETLTPNDYVSISSSESLTSSQDYILPNAYGTVDQVLAIREQRVTGARTLYWKTDATGGGGGIASMRVEDGGSFVVDTSTFDFTGTQFVVTNSGGEGLIALNTSSVTLYGPNIPAASISAGNLGSNVLVSSVSISAFYNQAQIRTNLGLAIGTNVQAWDADLDDLADGSLTGSKVGSGVPAANIASGSLGALVMASSLTATGVTAGSYLNANITVDATGRITSATTGVSSATAIEFIIDGSGTEIADGIKGDLEIPFACTLDRVTAIANESGSITVDIWKDTYANFPPTVADTITASAKPTITSGTKAQDTTLTGWTKSIAAGDILRFNVDAATTTTRVTISLKAFKQ
ncbi:MAG: hypothetical protein IPP74_13445 [Alphaproteobacteria bacterium]|nr:hypothetical protein [Alphaproteobacteria bacterium]